MGNLTVAEFWQQQNFAYLETYSFNRGPKSAEEYDRLSQEIAAIKDIIASGHPVLRTKASRQLRDLEEDMTGGKHNTIFLGSDAASGSTTQKIAVLHHNSPALEQLNVLVHGAGKQEAFSGCIPVYRDALVFYNEQHQQVRVLNICFECLYMTTDNKQLVKADFTTYEALQTFLLNLGHPIEQRNP